MVLERSFCPKFTLVWAPAVALRPDSKFSFFWGLLVRLSDPKVWLVTRDDLENFGREPILHYGRIYLVYSPFWLVFPYPPAGSTWGESRLIILPVMYTLPSVEWGLSIGRATKNHTPPQLNDWSPISPLFASPAITSCSSPSRTHWIMEVLICELSFWVSKSCNVFCTWKATSLCVLLVKRLRAGVFPLGLDVRENWLCYISIDDWLSPLDNWSIDWLGVSILTIFLSAGIIGSSGIALAVLY